MRGRVHYFLDHNEAALADFQQVVSLDPGYAWAFASRGETYRQMGRFVEAVEDMNRANR